MKDFIANNWVSFIALIILLLAVVTLRPNRADPIVGQPVIATPAPEVAREFKTDQPIKTGSVKAYAPSVKANLKLPANVVADDSQRVIESSRVAASERPTTVSTVINSDTGETVTYTVLQPYPLIDFKPQTEFGLYAGYNEKGQAIRLDVKQNLFAVKGVRVGALASAESSFTGPRWFAGVGLSYRW